MIDSRAGKLTANQETGFALLSTTRESGDDFKVAPQHQHVLLHFVELSVQKHLIYFILWCYRGSEPLQASQGTALEKPPRKQAEMERSKMRTTSCKCPYRL